MSVPGREDRELVDAVAGAGDEQAFGLLYDRHTPYLYRLALRLGGGNEPLAADLVHEAWVRAVERLPRFRWQSALRTWLAGFVVTVYREGARRRPEVELLPEHEPAGQDHLLTGTWDRLDLDRAIAALPSGYREVIVLHDVEGYSHAEIGALLGVDIGTSKSQLARARYALRDALAAGNSRRTSRE